MHHIQFQMTDRVRGLGRNGYVIATGIAVDETKQQVFVHNLTSKGQPANGYVGLANPSHFASLLRFSPISLTGWRRDHGKPQVFHTGLCRRLTGLQVGNRVRDYDKSVVEDERDDYRDKGWKAKELQIITTGDTQAEIDAAVAKLNEDL